MKEKVKLNSGDVVWLSGKGRDYRVIYPLKNEDGSWNVRNLLLGGSWRRFFQFLFVMGLILVSIFAYKHDVSECFKIIENPQSICNYQYYGNFTNVSLPLYMPNVSQDQELQDFGKANNSSVPSEKNDSGVFKQRGD